jgi:hypothetical protein
MIYTVASGMKRLFGFSSAIVLVSMTFAAQGAYLDGTIVDVQKKANTRVLYYVVNTPVTKDDPYYEVQVKVKDTVYTAQYTPRHEDDSLMNDYRPGAPVQARIEKRHMFLKREGGNDLDLVIVKRASVVDKGKAAESVPK